MLYRCSALATAVFAVFSLTGCDLVFGLDRSASQVNGTYLAHSPRLEGGVPVVTEAPFPVSVISVKARLDDGTDEDVSIDDSGAFSFSRRDPDQRYTLTFSSVTTSIYQLSTSSPQIIERFAGSPDRAEAPAGTHLALKIENRPIAGVGYEEVETTGTWSRHTPLFGQSIDFDWSVTPPGALPDGLLADAIVYYAGYDLNASPDGSSVFLRQLATIPAVTMQPGTTTLFTGTASPTDLASCVHVTSEVMTEGLRLAGAVEGGQVIGSTTWQLNAVPALEFTPLIGLPLVVAGDRKALPNSEWTNQHYATPYPGHQTVALLEADAQRIVGDAAFGMDSQLFVPVPPDCSSVLALHAGVISLAGQITLDGTELTTDGERVDLHRAKEIPISWTPGDGAADAWSVTLLEIGATQVTRLAMVTTQPRALIDPDLLRVNTTYVLRIRTTIGTPNAAAGDFATVAMPMGGTDVVSTTFSVR